MKEPSNAATIILLLIMSITGAVLSHYIIKALERSPEKVIENE